MSDGETKPPAPKTLASVWRAYVRMILDPVGAERIQRQETKRAFYAGASAVITILTGNLSGEGEPQQADFDLMDSVVAELNSFSDAVQNNRS